MVYIEHNAGDSEIGGGMTFWALAFLVLIQSYIVLFIVDAREPLCIFLKLHISDVFLQINQAEWFFTKCENICNICNLFFAHNLLVYSCSRCGLAHGRMTVIPMCNI